jgi:hypothetical protein
MTEPLTPTDPPTPDPDVADVYEGGVDQDLEATLEPGTHPRFEDYDRLTWLDLAEYLGWRPSTVRKLIGTEAWRWDELPWPAFYLRSSSRTHWLFADVRDWRGVGGRREP